MKVINEKGKLFGLINIIDLGVLLVILAVIAGGLWFMQREEEPGTVSVTTKEVFITLRAAGFSDDVVNAMKKGDRLYYADKLSDIEITDIVVEPAKMDVTLPDGTIKVSRHPELKDIYVTLKVNDPVDDPMIWVGALHATVGKDMTLKTTRVEIPAKIIKIVE